MSRAKGEGSITQRKDGRYQASIQDPHTGKRLYCYGATQKDAAAKLAELRRQIEAGVRVGDAKQPLEQYALHWLETSKPQWKPRSYTFYEGQVRLYIVPYLGKTALNRLTQQHIETWQATLMGRSTARAKEALKTLRTILNAAVDSDIITRNVAKRVRPPKHKPRVGLVLSREQEAALLAASPPQHALAWQLALTLGLRRGEIAALHWNDLAFEKAELRVREGKTASATRTLPMPQALAETLRAERQQQGSAGYVFGGVVDQTIGDWFRQDADKAGLTQFVLHDLRHTCLTRLAEQGVHPSVVQAVAGHASPELALRVYTHVDVDGVRRAMYG